LSSADFIPENYLDRIAGQWNVEGHFWSIA
jgi:hypothetical protein